MAEASDLKGRARSIFAEALRAVDAGAAVGRAVRLSGDSSRLEVAGEEYELGAGRRRPTEIYAVALGKAAYPMAAALDTVLRDKIVGGIVCGVPPENRPTAKREGRKLSRLDQSPRLSDKWTVFAGGHPLPNEASLAAAHACAGLLRLADHKNALVIFLVSGGGSAMIEAPVCDSVTLSDLRETNRVLVASGAPIGEINVLRRVLSRVKGGGLAKLAPEAAQISLIVSDTSPGDETAVASAPTIELPPPEPRQVVSILERHNLNSKLPGSVLKVLLDRRPAEEGRPAAEDRRRSWRVLLDNRSATRAAARAAEKFGFVTEVADEVSDQPVDEGCAEIVRRVKALRSRTGENKIACLISGGEFSCPVRGGGLGGRNSETALRIALMLDEKAPGVGRARTAFLSAGTDGIDGNSPAAGAFCDDSTVGRGLTLGLDARRYLETSDAYTFFRALDDALMTGATGTNVRDLRIILARG